MSRKRINTGLEGYRGPMFPKETENLNTLFDRVEIDGVMLRKMGETIEGFKEMDDATTQDDYKWFWGLFFLTEKGEVAVLFPKTRDFDKIDGVALDRSIAVYVGGVANFQEIKVLLERLQLRFYEKYLEEMTEIEEMTGKKALTPVSH